MHTELYASGPDNQEDRKALSNFQVSAKQIPITQRLCVACVAHNPHI